MSIRYKFIEDLDEETKATLQMPGRFLSRLPLHVLPIPVNAISPDGSQWLHCVEARMESGLLRIRVIIKNHRGVTVTVYSDCPEIYDKYRDLRFLIRNSHYVAITFPEIYVSRSKYMASELYLTANDFRLLNPDTESITPPKPNIII